MRSAIILLMALLPITGSASDHTYPPAAAPYATPDESFPLHVAILSASRHYHYHNSYDLTVTQTGEGNLLGEPEVGLAYKTKCANGFHHTHTKEFYQARWKKPNEKLELLIMTPGKKKPDVCSIDVTTRPEPYTHTTDKEDDEAS